MMSEDDVPAKDSRIIVIPILANVDEYLEQLQDIRRLSADEEQDAITRAKNGDRQSRAALVKSYLSDVADLAFELRPEWMEEEQAIAEANHVLLLAVNKAPETLRTELRAEIERRFRDLPKDGNLSEST